MSVTSGHGYQEACVASWWDLLVWLVGVVRRYIDFLIIIIITFLYCTCINVILFVYIYIRPKKHFKNEQRSKDAAAKKRPI